MSRLDDRTAALLATPSLAGLSYLLTHPEAQPEGFEFEFERCARCGMGLAFQVWGHGNEPTNGERWLRWAADLFDISTDDALLLFYNTSHYVTPQRLAARIDAYLAAHP